LNTVEAIFLGVVQGLTEFLPVSSSGHLSLLQSSFDSFEQPGLLYDTLLHFSTLLAVIIYFRKRFAGLFLAFIGFFCIRFRVCYHEQKDILWGIIIATVPTGVIGYALKDTAEIMMEKPTLVGYMLIVTSIMLFFAGRGGKGDKITAFHALIIGAVQAIAVLPGISRSGSTIFSALRLGLDRGKAAEFSFIVSVPAILGATLLQFKNITVLSTEEISPYLAGCLTAFAVGLISIAFTMRIVKKAKLEIFALYCLVIGIYTVL
jgi:undecaprenyl-diphosphatase